MSQPYYLSPDKAREEHERGRTISISFPHKDGKSTRTGVILEYIECGGFTAAVEVEELGLDLVVYFEYSTNVTFYYY